MSTKHVVFITRSRFWSVGAGLWARTLQTVLYLQTHARLTIVFCDDVGEGDGDAIRSLGLQVVVFGSCAAAEYGRMLCQLLETRLRHDPPDAIFIDKTETACLFPVLPRAALRLVDTHDLISARTRRALSCNAPESCPLTEAQEARLLDRFDRVICIQDDERRQVALWIGESKTLLAPHPVTATPIAIQKEVTRIGLLASNWHANVDGLRHFIDQVWPQVRRDGWGLHVYGGIAASFRDNRASDIHFHGLVQRVEECYANLDIAINPVRYGAGLKIKSVESLAHGVPLVTTRHGASGLETLANQALYIADTPEEFVAALRALSDDPSIRVEFNRVGSSYVRQHLTAERCFGGILSAINAHPPLGEARSTVRFSAGALPSAGLKAAARIWSALRTVRS